MPSGSARSATMRSAQVDDSATPDRPTPEARRSRGCWVALAVGVGVLLCGCSATVFLVLTGIIAEPETVIEAILRALIPG